MFAASVVTACSGSRERTYDLDASLLGDGAANVEDGALDGHADAEPRDGGADASVAKAPTFTNGQRATFVLGKPNFTSSGPDIGADGMYLPRGVAVDSLTAKVFVADNNFRVLRFPPVSMLATGSSAEALLGGKVFTTRPLNGAVSQEEFYPVGVATDRQGRLWVADRDGQRVLRFDNAAQKANGAKADGVLGQVDFTSSAAGFSRSRTGLIPGIATDASGRLWVVDFDNHRILRFDNAAQKANGADADGVIGQSDFASRLTGASATRLKTPRGVAVDPTTGSVFVADSGNNRILRYSSTAASTNGAAAEAVLGQSDFASSAAGTAQDRLAFPHHVVVDAFGRLWVTDIDNHRVLWFDRASEKTNGAKADGVLGQADFASKVPATTQTGFQRPLGVGVDTNGNVWVADADNSRVLFFLGRN